jgi:hypothetical protein
MTGLRTGRLADIEPEPAPQARRARLTALAPAPELASVAERLYAAMTPLAWRDEEYGWALAALDGAVGEMYQEVDDLARDTAYGPGWSSVMDLARCPDAWLPWLAQFPGVSVVAGTTPAEMRARILSTDGFRRGSPAAIRAATQATLTGSRTVYEAERFGGNAYVLAIRTITGETPNAAATRAAIIAQKPAGIRLDYTTVVGQTYDLVRVNYATYADVRAHFTDYTALRAGQAH